MMEVILNVSSYYLLTLSGWATLSDTSWDGGLANPGKSFGSEMNSPDWYVLYVKPRHEKQVAAMLRGKDLEEFLPLYARKTPSRVSELPLFPGYVFCRFDQHDRLPVLTVPGVLSILSVAGAPSAVQPDEMEALQRIVHNGLVRVPWPELPPGAIVTVSSGPLIGVQGVVVQHKNITRVVVSVSLLQRSIAVEVSREWLEVERMGPRVVA
jgi:transcription antitermination factor NusG